MSLGILGMNKGNLPVAMCNLDCLNWSLNHIKALCTVERGSYSIEIKDMNTRTLKLTLFSMVVLGLSGCFEDPKLFPCENGSGEVVTETRTVADFSKLTIDIPADIYLHRDTAFGVEIEAQTSLMEWIDTEVSGNMLEIRNDRCFRGIKTIRIDVFMPEVDYIEVVGSGDVYGQDAFSGTDLELDIMGSGSIELAASASDVTLNILGSGDAILDLVAESLSSRITGSGDLISQGELDVHDIVIEGSGAVSSFDLITNETSILISGSGDAEVYADSLLDVRINGSGDVFYKGIPVLDVSVNGSGEVVNRN